MKQGETLALNERIMLSLVSTGHDCPFIVCMTYAFHTNDKLCFILDLMNGGDLHYNLSQVYLDNFILYFLYFNLMIINIPFDLNFQYLDIGVRLPASHSII